MDRPDYIALLACVCGYNIIKYRAHFRPLEGTSKLNFFECQSFYLVICLYINKALKDGIQTFKLAKLHEIYGNHL